MIVVLYVVVKAETGILIAGGPLTRPVNEQDAILGARLSRSSSACHHPQISVPIKSSSNTSSEISL